MRDHPLIALQPSVPEDFEFLRYVHRAAMHDQIEDRFGWVDRFQAWRLRRDFSPERLRIITLGGERVGTIALTERRYGRHIDQFYLLPEHQGRGIGGSVLSQITNEADQHGWELRLSTLRDSRAARLYLRHGFVYEKTFKQQDYFRRPPGNI